MNFKQLEAFVTVADQGSFSQAAQPKATLETYNGYCEAGDDPEFGCAREGRSKEGEGLTDLLLSSVRPS